MLLVNLLRLGLLNVRRGQLHLDDVRTQLRCQLRSVCAHIQPGLALFGKLAAARVGPHHNCQAHSFGLEHKFAQLLIQHAPLHRAGVNGVADGDAAQAQRIFHTASLCAQRVGLGVQHIMVVQLQDQRYLPGKVRRAGLQESQRRCVGIAARVNRQLKVKVRIVSGGVGRKAARRPMLKALIHRQDHHAPAAAEAPVVQHARQVGLRAGVVAAIPAQNFRNACCHWLLRAVKIIWWAVSRHQHADGRSLQPSQNHCCAGRQSCASTMSPSRGPTP